MTPKPQERKQAEGSIPQQEDGNRIVISGMSGLYPNSHNVQEFSDILYNKVNPVTSDNVRYKCNHPEVAQHAGCIPEIEYFDAQFFKVNYRLAKCMDPMSRKVLEQAYQAIYDAGINPKQLSGSKIGVYVGICFSEMEKTSFYETNFNHGLGITGCSKSMFANRISYWLNAKGPSMSIDESCCSSTAALEQAYMAMSRGECEAAVVGGCHICMHPQSSVHYSRIIKLCPDGRTKSFDERADGCALSEAVSVLFLQKAKDAKRIYAEVLSVKTEFTDVLKTEIGQKNEFYRDLKSINNFLEKFYQQANIPPHIIEYVEALGCALPEIDKIELQAIEKLFCKNKEKPLLVGSVMSNMGYAEAATGISAITKVLLGYHNGQLAANLHCDQPRKDIAALCDGRMRIVNDHQPFDRTYVAVNGMSITGVNSHVLLHGCYKPKNLDRYATNIPHLVTISARHEQAVKHVLEILKSNPIDPEQLALLHNIHRMSTSGHLGRGFILLETNEKQKTVSLCEKTEYFDNARRPLWFVYSGMGSQWAGMGKQLMRIPIFAAAIERCRIALEPKGIDIVNIITSDDDSIFDNILHSFVGIAAIQIGLTDILHELGIKPDGIIALPEIDKIELQAIEKLFCKNKEKPLLVGSVMSNMGYAEAATGISAITKVLLGYHNGQLAANLHCDQPRKDIAALCDGRMRIVNDHQPFDRTYVAVNGMSITGVNSHVLLHGCYKPKNLDRYATNIPHLVTISARHEQAVKHVLEILKSNPIDPEQLALLHNIHRMSTSGHLGRGFILLETNEKQKTVSLCEKTEYFDNARRPLWFVYSGMGSQWAGMGKQLMRIPIFAAAIERCRIALEPKGIDIVNIITSDDDSIFDNILHSFVGIAAIQIGLTDILHELGIKPDGIIGHSVGELGCAYADNCLTAEEMILCAYYRGLVSVETKFIHGAMAAVGIGYKDILKLCPPEIEVACHNGPESSTISGPSNVVFEFIATLTAKGIFAREVPCSNIAYHSRYIADAGPGLLKYLRSAIGNPKDRSKRWLSTSVPKDKWDVPVAKTCSAEYLTNNLLNSVLFEETSGLVPSDAVLVEIAPHGLLQAILKRSMPASCKNITLTRRKHPDNAVLLLEAVGKLYLEGYNPNVQVLYPKVEMPVSTGTPFLSHFVKWAHDEKWNLPRFQSANRKTAAECSFILSLHEAEHTYLKGHSIRGKTLYPFAASLTLVWDLLAMLLGVTKKKLSVEFSDLHLCSQPVLHDQRQLKLSVSMHRGTGYFEILDDSSKVASGFIKPLPKDNRKRGYIIDQNKPIHLYSEDIYQLFRDRDYFYSGEFQSIVCIDDSLSDAKIMWRDNWITFIDGMLQLNALRQSHNAVSQPTSIRQMVIDIAAHNLEILNSKISDGNILIRAQAPEKYNYIRGGGVLIEAVKYIQLPTYSGTEMELKTLKFVPHHSSDFEDKLGGEYYVPLKLNQNETENENVSLQVAQFGDLDSLKWVAVPDVTGPGVIVNVHYAGININDLKQATGLLLFREQINNGYGMDFSGVTESGKRVMGIVHNGAASKQVKAQPELLWPVPAHWSLEDAATVPLAYVQAFYCLGIKAQIPRGKSVFIHGGAGALGQAIISIALSLDCEIFATVSNIHKKNFLLKLFPALKADHIGYSRDNTFTEMIDIIGKGKKCDIGISCVKGNLKDLTMRCINIAGFFYDISQIQDGDHYKLGMYSLEEERSYFSVDFSSIFNAENLDELKTIHKMVSEGIAHGFVRPLSRVTYAPRDVARAFRLLAACSHRGRVLLRMADSTVQAQFRMRCSADRCNLILCDKTAFGLQFADRLVARGAKQLYIHVPTQTPYLQHKIRAWQRLGIHVVVSSEQLNSQDAITSLLTSCVWLGRLEGVYIIAEEIDNDHNLIKNLDAEIRKLCSDLNYFAVINFGDNSTGKNVCLKRLSDHLPALVLQLPEVKEGSYGSYMKWRAAVDAVENALQSAHGVTLALEKKHKPSLLQEIAKLAELSIPHSAEKSLTLGKLGIKNHKLQSLCTFLQIQHNLTFNEEQVSSLTINTILNLERNIVLNLPREELRGLSTFIKYIDSDELIATDEFVILPTLVNMGNNKLVHDQIKLCIMPGMEGHHERFRVLCERLKIAAVAVQPGLDHPNETATETAQRYIEVLQKRSEVKDNFFLLGYESGICVALEAAAILESRGFTGTVFCVGCTPEELKTELEEQLSPLENEEQLQNKVLRHMYSLMTENDLAALDHAIQNLSTWSQKIEACVRILLGRVPHSAQYARSLIECALARINQIRNYSIATRQLRSQVILIRAAIGHSSLEDSVLQHISQQPLVVHRLNTPLAHITADLRCSAIINGHLDPKIREEFANRNTCNTYLLNVDNCIALDA